jgi:hypothetical protein
MAAAAAMAAGVATITGCGSNQSGTVFYGGAGIVGDDAGDSGGDAASKSGTDAAGDAPMVVAFYGIANPLPDGGSG